VSLLKEAYAEYIRTAFARTTYGKWLANEGVSTSEDWSVHDVWSVEGTFWPRLGGNAVFLNIYPMMEAERGLYVAWIAPGAALEPVRHLYEQIILVLDGHGTTEVWQEGDRNKHVFEWGRGSIFSPPLNSWYRMYNLGHTPVRFLAINRAPAIMNTFDDPEFIFSCPFAFRKRFDGTEGYFGVAPRQQVDQWGAWQTNFIPDVLNTESEDSGFKSAGGRYTPFRMAGNQTMCHISWWPVGRYHKAHYHGAGAMLLGLRSEGYVLIWPRVLGNQPYSAGNADGVVEIPWGRGSIYSPPSEWFHQHFNIGTEPAQLLAVRGGQPFSAALLGADVSDYHPAQYGTEEGGTILEYENEDPAIRRHYEAMLKERGVASAMPPEVYEPGYAAANPARSRR
jgi:hypothetical protein